MNMGRISAIFIKEAQDIRTNMNLLTMFVIPVALTMIYKNFIPEMPDGFALGMGLLFLATLVGMYVPAMTIAEEKEKRTLEVLTLSPAKPAEVFVGKGLLTFVSVLLTMVVLLLVVGSEAGTLPVIVVGMTLTAVVCIFIGMLIGLLSQNQMATGVVGMPVYMVFMLVPLLASHEPQDFIGTLAGFLPTHHFFQMLRLTLDEGQGLAQMGPQLAFLSASILVAFLLLMVVYRRKGLEQS
ncbi:ABC transporter permease [Dethiobacter alkaliphilus]|uniref:ABC-2 type transporter n=1 Tax=Dethiobacter alkaliphilus AHT 1 TaxID=555088 RepID=C0GFQ8_DETAL|nr:ABC transporter permease [Dethiobacter alkaliphilus]EEG78018.1 ABC-2 type transporter [Dethiobacter alkaliphilus AHT 1]